MFLAHSTPTNTTEHMQDEPRLSEDDEEWEQALTTIPAPPLTSEGVEVDVDAPGGAELIVLDCTTVSLCGTLS